MQSNPYQSPSVNASSAFRGMREFFKGLCFFIILVAGIIAAVGWADDRPSTVSWFLRIGMPLVCLGAVVWFLLIHFKRDVYPDYLHERVGRYFDRGGFCFSVAVASNRGVCYLQVPFQNQYENPCNAKVAIRPRRGFFQSGKVEAFVVEIQADSAAFGVARLAVPIPTSYQGTSQKFEVGATVNYPAGIGRQFRFRDGITIRDDANFRNVFRSTLQIAAIFAGAFLFSRSGSITLLTPAQVADRLPVDPVPEIETLWKLGDPLL